MTARGLRRGACALAALGVATLLAPAVWAGAGDATFLGVTTLLDSGDPKDKLDIVFLGDGFTADEQSKFNDRVDEAVQFFLGTHPFNALHCAFNIHRVNVASRESGTDIPATCPDGTSSTPRNRATALDTTFCDGSVFRCVGSSDPNQVTEWANRAPGANFVVVLINDGGYGGCRFTNQTFVTLDSAFKSIVVHELGHALSGLADEYSDDDPGKTSYPGGEPPQANLTVADLRRGLKWADLVVPGTTLPTSTCAAPLSPPFDLVGEFEGGNAKFSCGIFRPESTCRMRKNTEPFCSVCRRKLIQDIQPSLCSSVAVTFTDLLVRDDQDPWPRGSGEIYFGYQASSNSESASGRWPGASGEWDFDDGDEKSLNNFFVGEMPSPRAGTSTNVSVQVRESDWPDGDDTLSSDATGTFFAPLPATFTIDQGDYRLRGAFLTANVKVLLDTINIKDDQDGLSEGDIYVNYWISNGAQTIAGRWPTGDDDVGISSGDSREMAVYAGALPAPAPGQSFSLHVQVWDADSFLTFGDDQLGDDTFTFDASTGFGTTQMVHVEDHGNYRLTFSIVAAP